MGWNDLCEECKLKYCSITTQTPMMREPISLFDHCHHPVYRVNTVFEKLKEKCWCDNPHKHMWDRANRFWKVNYCLHCGRKMDKEDPDGA